MDKDNRDVCVLSAVDPRLNCGLVSAVLAGPSLTGPVQSPVRERARAERRYRLLSCPESAAAEEQLGAALAAEQLGAALAAEQLVQPAAEGAARQPTAAAVISAAAAISSRATIRSSQQQQQQR